MEVPTVTPPDWDRDWPTYILEVSDMDVKLPIEVIPNTAPPRFRWRQIVTGMDNQRHVQMCEGALPAGADTAVETVVGVANQLLAEREGLLRRVAELEAKEVAGTTITATTTNAPTEPAPTMKPVDMPTTGKKLR